MIESSLRPVVVYLFTMNKCLCHVSTESLTQYGHYPGKKLFGQMSINLCLCLQRNQCEHFPVLNCRGGQLGIIYLNICKERCHLCVPCGSSLDILTCDGIDLESKTDLFFSDPILTSPLTISRKKMLKLLSVARCRKPFLINHNFTIRKHQL